MAIMIKGLMVSAMMAVVVSPAFAQDAAAYDGTGVKPPKELLLKEGRTIGDIRLPAGAKVDAKASVIVGGGTQAYGKIIGGVKADSDKVARFFLDTMPGDGWELISEFQSGDITFVYQKPNRVVTILIERGKRNSELTITLTPRS